MMLEPGLLLFRNGDPQLFVRYAGGGSVQLEWHTSHNHACSQGPYRGYFATKTTDVVQARSPLT
jgi:hypothetical protein